MLFFLLIHSFIWSTFDLWCFYCSCLKSLLIWSYLNLFYSKVDIYCWQHLNLFVQNIKFCFSHLLSTERNKRKEKIQINKKLYGMNEKNALVGAQVINICKWNSWISEKFGSQNLQKWKSLWLLNRWKSQFKCGLF